MAELEFFAVYDGPSDYPEMVVVRRWVSDASGAIVPDAEPLALGLSVDDARDALRRLRPGMIKLDRHALDDPAIVEVWF